MNGHRKDMILAGQPDQTRAQHDIFGEIKWPARLDIQMTLPMRTLFDAASLGQFAEAVLQRIISKKSSDELGSLLNKLHQISDEEARQILAREA